MAIAHMQPQQLYNGSSRWCGDLPISAYREAIELLNAARTLEQGWDILVLGAQKILLKQLISPPGGGVGQRLAQLHEHLYDQLSKVYLLKDRIILGDVIWTLRELNEMETELVLIPYGCTNLRITEFPLLKHSIPDML